MMILANLLEKTDDINQKDFLKFLQIPCPFAPHLTEELSSLLVKKEYSQEFYSLLGIREN